MNCPIDGTALVMSERNGIEIDYCPQCRGVWLDRGELDKIIERAAQYEQRPPQQSVPEGYKRKNDEVYRGDYDDDDYKYRNDPQYKRKKSIWGEIFDFD
jgi:uncharacterized protein